MSLILDGTNGLSDVDGTAATPAIRGTDTNTGIFFPAADTIAFAEGGTEVARIDANGNLGIGTSSITGRLNVRSTYVSDTTTQQRFEDNTGSALSFGGTGGGVKWLNVADTGAPSTGYPLAFQTGGTERMRIDSAGRVQIGTTATSPAPSDTYGIVLGVDGAGGAYAGASQFSTNGTAAIVLNRGGDNGTTMLFRRSGTSVGAINVTTSSTAYVTSSDYRLKENIAPMTGALGVVSQLTPVTYNWKVDGSSGQGFIAHELQAVVPDCVTGEKDAVDEEGNPDYQGIDTSFLVATLTAAIQEQQAMITSLTERIVALEGTAA